MKVSAVQFANCSAAEEHTTTMTVEGNKTIARRVLEDLVTRGRLEVVDEIYARSFEFRDPTMGRTITMHEGMKDFTRELRAQAPDISVTIEEEIAEGDAVVHRWTARWHSAPSGELWTVPGISIYHLREGRIVSEYVIPDGNQENL
jgi:ketosteroid isomerase-like protein